MSDLADPRELLNALLDGELTDEEEREVRAWLDANPDGQAELDALNDVRGMVRSLPPVDPPFGFYERLLLDAKQEPDQETSQETRSPFSKPAEAKPKRRSRRAMVGGAIGAIAAVAATFVLVLGITPATDKIVPPVNAFADRHDSMAEQTTAPAPAPPSGGDYETLPPQELDSMRAPFMAPAQLGGFTRVGGYRHDGVVHVVYRNGSVLVSFYEQRGDVDWEHIPSDGVRLTVGENKAWESTSRDGLMVLDLDDDVVLTMITSAPQDQAMAIAQSVPNPPDPSMMDRVNQHCSDLLRGFTAGS